MKLDFLKAGHRCRPGGSYEKTSITIHSTGNANSTASNERAWLDNPQNTREASWHYCVDAKEIVQAIPDAEEAWHCGKTEGNRHSIGIELCESGDRRATLLSGAALAASLLKQYGLGLSELKQHFDWTGKNCPRILRQRELIKNGMDWAWFCGEVEKQFKGGAEMEKTYQTLAELPDWARNTIQKLMNKGFLNGDGNGLGLTETALKVFVVNDRAGLYGKGDK